MARNRKTYDDDDGRTIADMSGVTRRNLWQIRIPGDRQGEKDAAPQWPPKEKNEDRPWDTSGQINREERRAYILGALGAAMLIGLPFAVVIAAAIYIIGHFHF